MLEAKIHIKICTAKDLELIERALPTGPSKFHTRRFIRQEKGESKYLIAYLNNQPVGHLHLKWRGSNAKIVHEKIGLIPELNAISVKKELRSRGIGTQLILEAESMAETKAFSLIGLAVGVENPQAKALYQRLGYKEWSFGTFTDSWHERLSDGSETKHKEVGTYMIKNIKKPPKNSKLCLGQEL